MDYWSFQELFEADFTLKAVFLLHKGMVFIYYQIQKLMPQKVMVKTNLVRNLSCDRLLSFTHFHTIDK